MYSHPVLSVFQRSQPCPPNVINVSLQCQCLSVKGSAPPQDSHTVWLGHKGQIVLAVSERRTQHTVEIPSCSEGVGDKQKEITAYCVNSMLL